MSSGFGLRGGPGRCYEHFQDIARCSVCIHESDNTDEFLIYLIAKFGKY